MWYQGGAILKNSMALIPKKDLRRTRLFIGAANTMPKGMSLDEMGKDGSAETVHIRSVFKLDNFIKSSPDNGLKYMFRYYDKESHVSVPLMSEYDGLRFIFDYYLMDVSEKDLLDSTADIAERYRRHYDRISNEMGYRNAPPETFINYLGYDALAKKQFDRARALFQLNVENYPGSNTVHESYADYLLSRRDTIGAVANYKTALRIKNDESTRHKLDALEGPGKLVLTSGDLQKYAGVYVLENFNVEVVLVVQGEGLWAKVKGQADDELAPLAKDVFTVRNKQGYTITFKTNGDKAVAFTSVQPNGTFNAVLKR
jgi:hypothetical protein